MTKKNQAVYEKIADFYRAQIESGELAKGDKLPSVVDMTAAWDVATATVNRAINLLKSEGLIDVRRGARATVRKVVPLVRIAPERYFRPHTQATWVREAERAGRAPEVEHFSERVAAAANIADRLGISEGDPVIRTRYLIKMSGEPVTKSVAYEPYAVVGGTEIERPHEGPLANRGIIPRFDYLGIHIDEVEEVLKYRVPTSDEVQILQLDKAERVVEITQTFRAEGTPLETADIVFVADRYELRYRMQIPLDGIEPSSSTSIPSKTEEQVKAHDEVQDPRETLPWPFGTVGG